MRVKASVPCRARELLIVLVADVAARPGVFVALRETEIDDVNHVLLLPQAD